MKVTKITVTYGRTFNLGDYNAARLSTSLEAELEEDELPGDVTPRLQEMCRDAVKAEFMRLKPQAG